MAGKKPRFSERMRRLLRVVAGSGKPRETTPYTKLLRENRRAVNTLNEWRRAFSIGPSNEVDRAVAMLIELTRERYPAEWGNRLEQTLGNLKKENPDTVPVRICIGAEEMFIKKMEAKRKSAKGSEAKKLEETLGRRREILSRLKQDLAAGGASGLIFYGDAQLPPWFNAAHPAQPEFQRIILGMRK